MERHQQNAIKIARFLKSHKGVEKSCLPGHKISSQTQKSCVKTRQVTEG